MWFLYNLSCVEILNLIIVQVSHTHSSQSFMNIDYHICWVCGVLCESRVSLRFIRLKSFWRLIIVFSKIDELISYLDSLHACLFWSGHDLLFFWIPFVNSWQKGGDMLILMILWYLWCDDVDLTICFDFIVSIKGEMFHVCLDLIY